MRSTLTNLANMFRVPDLRNKVLFTLLIIVIYRFGANIPCPGIDFSAVQSLVASSQHAGVVSFLNLFSGGALTKFAVFGLGIMPYITSSIIVQLLMVVIPKFEQWRDEGAVGQKKLTQVTRYLTIALAVLQSTGLAYVFHNGGGGLLGGGIGPQHRPDPQLHGAPGAADRADHDRRHGRGHVARRADHPARRRSGHVGADLHQRGGDHALRRGADQGRGRAGSSSPSSSSCRWSCWWPSSSSSRASGGYPVTFAKRVVGRRMYGGQSTYIPMKVNTGGVVPIIFASSVLYFPILISNVLPSHGFWKQRADTGSACTWPSPTTSGTSSCTAC